MKKLIFPLFFLLFLSSCVKDLGKQQDLAYVTINHYDNTSSDTISNDTLTYIFNLEGVNNATFNNFSILTKNKDTLKTFSFPDTNKYEIKTYFLKSSLEFKQYTYRKICKLILISVSNNSIVKTTDTLYIYN